MSSYNPILGGYTRNNYGLSSMYGDRRYNSILEWLRGRNEERRAERETIVYNRRPEDRPRPHERDLKEEKERIEENRRRTLEELEEKFKEEENERARLEAEKLEEIKDEVLLVQAINEHIKKNTEDHHTDLFECTESDKDPQLVVRRGQEFKLTLTLQRPYDRQKDDMYIIFQTGTTPKIHKKTKAMIKLREDDKTRYMTGGKRSWGARIMDEKDNKLTLLVYTPPNAVIGEWEYKVMTVQQDKKLVYEGEHDLVLLFNPWCEDDETYLEETNLLNEYVLNPTGTVYYGDSSWLRSKPWNYGQFQKDILKICLKLLRKANEGQISSKMASSVWVSRALSRVLNSCDAHGVLVGRWDGEYSDGTRPLSWQGSPAILKQFEETGNPVKYGQCWVFSHLLTTVARAIGLPCRSMTNFSSAHDTDLSMTIDKYVDEDGDEIDHMNKDSVWNYHVWNEVWMHRPDLDKAFNVKGKYDGWQAVDATPQELSEGTYQCGPSPLSAIKLGEVHVGYDTPFIFGEVNAERCTWKRGDPPVLISRDTVSVGKKMSTKCPDGEGYIRYPSWDKQGTRLDVTDLYKAAEGSAAERAAVERATRQGDLGEHLFVNNSGIELTMVQENEPEIGEEFVVKVKAKNTSQDLKRFGMRVTVRPTTYWGSLIKKKIIDRQRYPRENIEPGNEKVYELHVSPDEYVYKCDDAMSMRILALGQVKGHKDPVFLEQSFSLRPPEIVMEGPTEPIALGQEYDVKITFKNPLPNSDITECELRVDGSVFLSNPGFELQHAIYKKKLGVLKAGETQTIVLKTLASEKPRNSKRREVTVDLASKELPDMEGSFTMQLK